MGFLQAVRGGVNDGNGDKREGVDAKVGKRNYLFF